MINTLNCATAAAVRLTIEHPFWTEIYYSMTVFEVSDDPQVRTLATDGRDMWINPKFWATLSTELQVSALVHEMAHKILLHPSRRGHRTVALWQIAADHAANNLLESSGFKMGKGWLCDKRFAGMSAEAIHSVLMREEREQPGRHVGALSPELKDMLEFKGTPEQIEQHEEQVKVLVERAVANARAMGSLPAGIEAGVVTVYQEKREPWYNHLHRFMQALSSSQYNWARLNRRTLASHGCFTPMHASESLGDIALFIDASGSCFDAASQADFAGHLNAILGEARPRSVHLYYFDAAVYRGGVIEAGTLDFQTRPVGGGGTSFEPIFEALEADGIEPEVCIILTDLMGSFPHRAPDYPVVWANIFDHGEAPFGDTIYVN